MFGGNKQDTTTASIPTVGSAHAQQGSPTHVPSRQGSGSSAVAQKRLHLILSRSRADTNLTADTFTKLQEELLSVVSKYISVNPELASLTVRNEPTGIEIFEMTVPLDEDSSETNSSKASPQKSKRKKQKKSR